MFTIIVLIKWAFIRIVLFIRANYVLFETIKMRVIHRKIYLDIMALELNLVIRLW